VIGGRVCILTVHDPFRFHDEAGTFLD
jgi:hypothetical protein